jgi:O-antigen ligase
MSAVTATREVAALVGTGGLVLLLAPIGRPSRATARKGSGLAVLMVAWAVLAASLVPSHDARRAVDKLGSPAIAGAAVVGLLVAIAACVLLVRLFLARPWTWFLLLALALPVRFPVSLGSSQSSANLLVPLYAVILLGLAAWIWGRLRGRLDGDGEAGTPLDLPLLAFVGFTLVSTLWSDDSQQAAVKAVFFYIPFVLLLLLVVAWWGHAPALKTLAVATVAMAVPVAILAVGQYATHEIFWNHRLQQANVYSRFFRANGIFYDPNILGRYLVLALLIVLAYAYVTDRGRDLLILGAAAIALGAGLFVTFSRSSALGLMVGVALLALRAYGWRRTLIVGGAVLIVLGGAAVLRSGNVRHALTSSHRLERISEGRFDLVKGGLKIWREHPVAGTGLGSFEKRYTETLTPAEQRRTRVIISHNAPVTVLSEVGAVGFALFLVLLVAGTVTVARTARAPGADGWAAWTILAMLAAIFVHSLLYAALFEDPYTWVLTGAALGLRAAARRAEATVPAVPRDPLTVGGPSAAGT